MRWQLKKRESEITADIEVGDIWQWGQLCPLRFALEVPGKASPLWLLLGFALEKLTLSASAPLQLLGSSPDEGGSCTSHGCLVLRKGRWARRISPGRSSQTEGDQSRVLCHCQDLPLWGVRSRQGETAASGLASLKQEKWKHIKC